MNTYKTNNVCHLNDASSSSAIVGRMSASLPYIESVHLLQTTVAVCSELMHSESTQGYLFYHYSSYHFITLFISLIYPRGYHYYYMYYYYYHYYYSCKYCYY